MIFLYKLSLLNENEIRNGLDPRSVYVAASSMDKAITCYPAEGSMISCCEFLYPITVVSSDPSCSKLKYDNLYRILYTNDVGDLLTALVCATDVDHAKERLYNYLNYIPDIEQVYTLDDIIL